MSCILCAGKIEAAFQSNFNFALSFSKRGAAQSSAPVHYSADTEAPNTNF